MYGTAYDTFVARYPEMSRVLWNDMNSTGKLRSIEEYQKMREDMYEARERERVILRNARICENCSRAAAEISKAS